MKPVFVLMVKLSHVIRIGEEVFGNEEPFSPQKEFENVLEAARWGEKFAERLLENGKPENVVRGWYNEGDTEPVTVDFWVVRRVSRPFPVKKDESVGGIK